MNVGVIAAAAAAAARAQAVQTADVAWGPYAASRGMRQRLGRIGWARVEWPRLDARVDNVSVAIELVERDSGFATAALASIESPIQGHLEVTREGFLTSVLKFFGAQDIVLGDDAFDEAFRVKASSEELAKTLLTPWVREEMQKLSCRWLAYDDGSEHGHTPMVLFEVGTLVEWPDVLDRMLALVTTLSQTRVSSAAYR